MRVEAEHVVNQRRKSGGIVGSMVCVIRALPTHFQHHLINTATEQRLLAEVVCAVVCDSLMVVMTPSYVG